MDHAARPFGSALSACWLFTDGKPALPSRVPTSPVKDLVPPPHASTEHYDSYWGAVKAIYPLYPTIRHRKRFILDNLRKQQVRCGKNFSVFDFGCGEGSLLNCTRETFNLQPTDIGGSDISPDAVRDAQQKVPGAHVLVSEFPVSEKKYSAVICSEVIEHTRKYRDTLSCIYDLLESGGVLLLTTQTGKIHASDIYTGHTQHFVLSELTALLKELGYSITSARTWGFPFFTLQKYMTDVNFQAVRTGYLEGELSPWKRFVFACTTFVYYVHDLIPFGPQIYIVAKKG